VAFEIFDLGSRNLAARSEAGLLLLYLGTFFPIAVAFWLLMRDGGWPWLRRHAAVAAS